MHTRPPKSLLTDLSVCMLVLLGPLAAHAEPVAVRTVTVAAQPGPAAAPTATGTLEPLDRVPLALAVAGVVDAVLVDEGQRVGTGDALVRLDPVPFRAAVDRLQAQVRFLEQRTARSRTLRERKAITPEEVDAQEAELAARQAELRLARWNLDRSVLRAPSAGVVSARHVEVGQVVAAGTPALEILDPSTLELRVAVSAQWLPRLDLEAPVEVRIPSWDDRRGTARLHHRPIQGDPRSGSVPLLLRLSNPDGELLPGLAAEARFAIGGSAAAWVPVSAVRMTASGARAFRVEDGRAREIGLTVGRILDGQVEVLEGAAVGDRLVDAAPDRLRHDDAIRTDRGE